MPTILLTASQCIAIVYRGSRSILLLFFIAFCARGNCQDRIDSLLSKLDPQKFANSIEKKVKGIDRKLQHKSIKCLDQLKRREEKVYRRALNGADSLVARKQLAEIGTRYAEMKEALLKGVPTGPGSSYLPSLDTLSTALSFFRRSVGNNSLINSASQSTELLKKRMEVSEEIRKFIQERKEALKQQLVKLGKLQELKRLNKQVYYYSQQILEYKQVLSDPDKALKKALALLRETKMFKEFFRRNSILALLFRLPDNNDPVISNTFYGLQTRIQISGMIQQQIASGGPNAQQILQQNMQAAQSELNELKTKILQKGGSNSQDLMPEGFKPNSQKTKPFLKRLEYGTMIQSQKQTGLLPVTSDIGLSVGFKINDKSIIGIGASYKLGWGNGWNRIRLSSEGTGLRSFIDWKIKGSIWVSGGFEMNYRSAFESLTQLKETDIWQKSGLVGLSKTLAVKTKFFKKTKLLLLWDFLSYDQVPRSRPLLFRVAYNFK